MPSMTQSSTILFLINSFMMCANASSDIKCHTETFSGIYDKIGEDELWFKNSKIGVSAVSVNDFEGTTSMTKIGVLEDTNELGFQFIGFGVGTFTLTFPDPVFSVKFNVKKLRTTLDAKSETSEPGQTLVTLGDNHDDENDMINGHNYYGVQMDSADVFNSVTLHFGSSVEQHLGWYSVVMSDIEYCVFEDNLLDLDLDDRERCGLNAPCRKLRGRQQPTEANL